VLEKHLGGHTKTVTTEFQLADKLRALELLGRHLGMFKDGPPVVQISLAEVLDMLDGKRREITDSYTSLFA
jgi:hypothetical protein